MKAVISTGGNQFVVSKGDEIDIPYVGDKKSLTFEPLMIIDDKNVSIGNPVVAGAKVSATVTADVRAPKVTAIRFKSKKRVHKRRGHKQQLSRVQISSISVK